MIKNLGIDSLSILEYWRKCVKDASCAEPKLIRDSKAYEERTRAFQYYQDQEENADGPEVLSEEQKTDTVPDFVEPICIENFDMSNGSVNYGEIAKLERLITGNCGENETIKILIAPFRIKKASKKIKAKDPEAYHYYYPFWYPAAVLVNGMLAVPKFSHPFIPRKMLYPYENKSNPFIIGQSIDYDHICAKFDTNFDTYNNYISAVKKFFFDITKNKIEDFKVEKLERQNTATIVLNDGFSASHNIIRLYNHLVDTDKIPSLLKNLVEGYDTESRKLHILPDKFTEYEHLQSAAMVDFEDAWNGKDSSDSQKSALLTWFKDADEKILAVTGPPGTGKTYLLKNLVANAIVTSAIEGKHPDPHIFIAASLSNQAIKNVIDYLEESCKYRWLPDAGKVYDTSKSPTKLGAGVFMASKSAEESNQKNLFIQNNFQGSYKFYESLEYIDKAEEDFKTQCKKEYDVPENQKISEFLQEELRQQVTIVQNLKSDTEHLPAYRIGVFKIALHYWEARWLEEARVHIGKNIPSVEEFVRLWKWRAMLTPCFAGTFHTLPDIFLYKEKSEEGMVYHYLTEIADTLIVDEAGQVTPEIGAPTFAFSKRAIVLGDVQQIEPIWDITREVDLGNLQMCNISCDDKTLSAMHESGLLCSSGNIMKLAQNATWIKSEIKGIPLKEHFRCYNEIIGFCDELCYNYIIPKVGPSNFDAMPECEEPFPPFQIIPIDGTSHSMNGRSQCNELECYAIRQWIEKNSEKIRKIKPCIQDAISILTPYKSQVSQIKALLKGEECKTNSKKLAGLENILSYTDEEGEKHDMRVGTVHSLQGSQRHIILFSCVVSQEDGLDFIDSHMVNVAVSRAQNSFIAFANPKIFQKQGDYPLKKMNEYYQSLVNEHPEYILDNSYITVNPKGIRWRKRIFISYRHNDENVANCIIKSLVSFGYPQQTIFIDFNNIRGGDNFPAEIKTAIGECNFFILLYSQESVERCPKENDWVAKEILAALDEECRIIPINIGNCQPDWSWIEDESKCLKMESTSWIPYSDEGEYRKFENKLKESLIKRSERKESASES